MVAGLTGSIRLHLTIYIPVGISSKTLADAWPEIITSSEGPLRFKSLFFFSLGSIRLLRGVRRCCQNIMEEKRRTQVAAIHPSAGARLISRSLAKRAHLGEARRDHGHLDKLSETNEMSGWSRRRQIGSDHSP